MEVFLGGSRNLEALPSVCRTPVQQLRPGYVVLAWNADLPVSVDHKLGATVLEGWMREEGNGKKEGKENISKCQQLALHISGSCWGKGGMKETERCQLAIYGSCLSSVLGFSMTWDGNKHLHLPCPSGRTEPLRASLSRPQRVPFRGQFYFGLINKDENRCPWLLCCLENTQQVQRPDGTAEPPLSLGRGSNGKSRNSSKVPDLHCTHESCPVCVCVCERLNLT